MATLTTRRTQKERRLETRGRLLDATIESLLEAGYAGTTQRAVAARAGVSSGAMTHHFPHRVDLVGAALERLAVDRISTMRDAARRLSGDVPARVAGLLDLVWKDFSAPIFEVFVKAWIAAAHDPELYERLVPIERVLAREVAEATAELGGPLRVPDLEARILTMLATARGLALTQSFEPRSGRRPRSHWSKVRPILERMIVEP